MKKLFPVIFWLGIVPALTSTKCTARIVTVPVSINSPDSSLRVYIMTTAASFKPYPGKRYYWYSNNSIISAYGSFSGRLLHGTYTSYYSNHFLRQQGTFCKGLKNGNWITWYPDGTIKERLHFSHGVVEGKRELYDSSGALTMLIYYRNGAKSGKTKFFSQGKLDSTICFKKGVVVNKKKRKHGETFLRRNRKSHARDSVPREKPGNDTADIKKKDKERVAKKTKKPPGDSVHEPAKQPVQHTRKFRLFNNDRKRRSRDTV